MPFLNYSDIISTFCAIELAYSLSESSLLLNQNIEEFINSTWFGGSYRLTNNSLVSNPETTFYGVKSFLGMNMSYNLGEVIAFFRNEHVL
jgi:hypothetical protein